MSRNPHPDSATERAITPSRCTSTRPANQRLLGIEERALGLSRAEIVRRGLGLVEDETSAAFETGYWEGFNAARVSFHCAACGGWIIVTPGGEAAKVATAVLEAQGWRHRHCPERSPVAAPPRAASRAAH